MKVMRISAAVVAIAGMMVLSGCSTQESTSDEPVQVGTSSGYEVEYVEVDGETIKCLWYNKGARSGTMSCDWENPIER